MICGISKARTDHDKDLGVNEEEKYSARNRGMILVSSRGYTCIVGGSLQV